MSKPEIPDEFDRLLRDAYDNRDVLDCLYIRVVKRVIGLSEAFGRKFRIDGSAVAARVVDRLHITTVKGRLTLAKRTFRESGNARAKPVDWDLVAPALEAPNPARFFAASLRAAVTASGRALVRQEQRSAERIRYVPLDKGTEPPDESACSRLENAELVEHLIGALPENLQEVIKSYYFLGMTQEEVARKLGMPVARVSKLLGRAHVELRRKYKATFSDRRRHQPLMGAPERARGRSGPSRASQWEFFDRWRGAVPSDAQNASTCVDEIAYGTD